MVMAHSFNIQTNRAPIGVKTADKKHQAAPENISYFKKVILELIII